MSTVVLGILLLAGGAAHAQGTSGTATVEPPVCAANAGVLGISRIVEIDTDSGPRFGEQYKGGNFLSEGEVVLTFDDGPMRRYTLPILDALDEQCTKATFFAVGRMAVADPTTLKEVARRGHTIGTHTWSHQKLSKLSTAAATREIELGISAVSAALEAPVAPFFRFPYLADSKATLAHLAERDIATFSIDVDSRDFRTRSPGTVLREVLRQLEKDKKGILLFHDIQPSTAGALSSVLAALKERDFKVVHMVAKTPVTTVAAFDTMAAKALSGKSAASKSTPLADRSVTWPVSGAEAAEAPASGGTASAAAKSKGQDVRKIDWGNIDDDPWQLRSFGNSGGP